jgi:hypothetical protein
MEVIRRVHTSQEIHPLNYGGVLGSSAGRIVPRSYEELSAFHGVS